MGSVLAGVKQRWWVKPAGVIPDGLQRWLSSRVVAGLVPATSIAFALCNE